MTRTVTTVDREIAPGPMPLFVNGRVQAAGPGGFATFHHEVTSRLAAERDLTVLEPGPKRRGPLAARWWEQRTLPALSGGGVLLSTANNGPAAHRRQVVVVHDLLPLTRPDTVSPLYAAMQRQQLPRLCRAAAAIITVSHQVADQLVTLLGVDRARITVIPPGIGQRFLQRPDDATETAAAAEFGIDRERPVVTAVVSSIPRKNSVSVVDALDAVARARPRAQVIVAGYDGPRRVFGRGAVRPSHRAVADLGPIGDQQMATLFRAADVFVSLTKAEGFGLPPVEAFAADTAVVSTPVPSLTEHLPGIATQVAFGDHNSRVDSKDLAEQAADAVIDLLDNPAKRAAQAASGRAAVQHLTWDRTAAAVAQVLLRLEPNGH